MNTVRFLSAASLIALLAGVTPGVVAAAEGNGAAQDLLNVKRSDQVISAVWMRQPDSYAVKIVLDATNSPASATAPSANIAPSVAVDQARQPPALDVADALRALVPQNSAGAPYHPVFVDNTIDDLRKLAPVFGCSRTLTIMDGRRAAPQRSYTFAPSLPAGVPDARSRDRRVEVWLLKADGTQIQPAGYRCEYGMARSGDKDASISYGYSLADGAQAVAAAIRVDDSFFIEKLQP